MTTYKITNYYMNSWDRTLGITIGFKSSGVYETEAKRARRAYAA